MKWVLWPNNGNRMCFVVHAPLLLQMITNYFVLQKLSTGIFISSNRRRKKSLKEKFYKIVGVGSKDNRLYSIERIEKEVRGLNGCYWFWDMKLLLLLLVGGQGQQPLNLLYPFSLIHHNWNELWFFKQNILEYIIETSSLFFWFAICNCPLTLRIERKSTFFNQKCSAI